MVVLNGMMTPGGDVYWKTASADDPETLTLLVDSIVLRANTATDDCPPAGDDFGTWTLDLDALRERADSKTAEDVPPWASGRVSMEPTEEGKVLRFDISRGSLAD